MQEPSKIFCSYLRDAGYPNHGPEAIREILENFKK